MKTVKLAYWAGFFDGEGHVELVYANPRKGQLNGHYIFALWINQWTKTPEVLFSELLENFGGVAELQKNSPNNFRWRITGPDGRRFLEALLPYLRKKKRQAELGIEMQKRMQSGHGGKRVRLQEPEILARDAILVEYSLLFEGNKPKRKLNLGQYHLLKGKKQE